MCGIVGYVGNKNAVDVLMNCLKALEYRGYDSAGIAYKTCNRVEILKVAGKIKRLENKLKKGINSNIGIGHTRWATHGKPDERNAHPHRVGKFTVVHNGIIENYESLKRLLSDYKFKSDTDSEVIAALLDKLYYEKNDVIKVLGQLKKLLVGSFALAIMCDDEPDNIYAIKKDSPLIIGVSDNENFIASDVPAILKYTDKYIIIDAEDVAVINTNVSIYNDKSELLRKEILTYEGSLETAEKHGYAHFMLKEIHEEPEVVKNTILPFLKYGLTSLEDEMPDFSEYDCVNIIGCGSAYHAGLIGKFLLEKHALIKTDVYIASEFRYQKIFTNEKTLVILISQSGETADTLACLRKVKEMGIDTLAIVNVVGSSLAREATKTFYIKAGPEISVATTKAYMAQLALISLISLQMGIIRNVISENKATEIIKSFESLPDILKSLLDFDYKAISKSLYKKDKAFYIGRGVDYTLCMEGSLKLKEISYITSGAFPAGEMKHGTISLVEKGSNVIAIITDKDIADKTINNIKEVSARGAVITLITTDKIDKDLSFASNKVVIPATNDFINPMVATIPLQLISYETAKLRGCEIDMPKNLTKSVTVE